MAKNYLTVLIASFFIAGLMFFALPDDGWAQPDLGCCQNNNSGMCIPGTQTPEQCMDNLPSRTWFPNDPPCMGGQFCASFTPTGCCDGPATGQCQAGITEAACVGPGGVWDEGNAPCMGVPGQESCGDPIGCCFTDLNGTTCDNNVVAGACDGTDQSFFEGEVCNSLSPPTCGEAGCCQFGNGDPSCRETNFSDCRGGDWTSNDECTESGECASNVIGCCVFGKNDCADISEQECRLEEGKFKDVECSEVPICNVVSSPIPTLNQWGLIAMAGLLGLFSLFIIIRRHRYNLS